MKSIFGKFLQMILVLWGVATVVFLLFSVLPGDPVRMMMGQNEDPEQLAAIRKKLGFDLPLHQQYLLYLNDISPLSIHPVGDGSYSDLASGKYKAVELVQLGGHALVIKGPYLRESFQRQGTEVSSIIAKTLPNTVVLALSAISLAIVLGVFLGILSALAKDSFWDRALLFLTSIGMSLPSFFSAILMAWFFAYVFGDYTGLKMSGSLYEVDDFGEGKHLALKNLLLPAITLGIRPLAVISQLTRNSLLEVLSQDYIRTAYAKGLSRFAVIWKHALKNALNPVITATSGWFAGMLAGAVFVEFIFGWNGLGKEIVYALNTLDLPVVMGAVLTIALMFILINILVDVIYGWLDPRVNGE